MPRYAAIDIGSNSVRMQAAEVSNGAPPRILAAERQVTRLGASVFRTGRISPESMSFVCQTLANMAQIYNRHDVLAVRAVATAAVRDASNQTEFLLRASEVLGAPVEIISGQEEARLIHLGVQARWPHPKQRIVILDIGGGSAEIILGESGSLSAAFSRPLGAVRLQELFLKTDPPRPGELHQLETYIDERIAPAIRRIQAADGPVARLIATSATASAVVCALNQVSRARRDDSDKLRASAAGVRRLYKDLTQMDCANRARVTGIGPRRAEIIIPGAAVLHSVLAALGMSSVYYSAAGVRDGIIADLALRGMEREFAQLDRQQRRVVEELASRCRVPIKHVRKVAQLAGQVFVSLQSAHRLPPHYGKLLEAAAYLHDVGHFISDTRHHKHSYYLVANSDMPGFEEKEREFVANLCRYHRKAPPALEHANLQTLDPDARKALNLLVPLLRLADSLDRSEDQRVKSVDCFMRDSRVEIALRSDQDVDLEIWAAERSGEFFQQVYGLPLVAVKARS